MSIYDFIKEKEGFRDQAYDDAVGVRTIGYGRTGGSFEPTTREAEDAWLKKRVDSERRYVEKYAKDHGYDWSPQQIDALSSFTFNLGRGRLDQLTQGGQRDNATIGNKIKLYNKAGGKELAGLVTRRNEEAAMFSGNPGGVPQSTFPGPHATVPSPQPIPPRVGGSFNEAFAAARQAQGAGGQFEWDGNFYTTNLKEEEEMKKYNKGTGKVKGKDPSAVSSSLIHTADTLAPWISMLFQGGTTKVPGYQDGTTYSEDELQRMLRDPYAESRFFGPVIGHSDKDPLTGETLGVQAPDPSAGMPEEVRKRGWAWGKKKRRWNENYGDWYNPKTGKLMTPDEFAAYHGFPPQTPPPPASEAVPNPNVNHPDFSRMHPLHPANRDIAAPDPLESMVAGDPRTAMAPGSLPGVPVDHPDASPMGQQTGNYMLANVKTPYREMSQQEIDGLIQSGDVGALAEQRRRNDQTTAAREHSGAGQQYGVDQTVGPLGYSKPEEVIKDEAWAHSVFQNPNATEQERKEAQAIVSGEYYDQEKFIEQQKDIINNEGSTIEEVQAASEKLKETEERIKTLDQIEQENEANRITGDAAQTQEIAELAGVDEQTILQNHIDNAKGNIDKLKEIQAGYEEGTPVYEALQARIDAQQARIDGSKEQAEEFALVPEVAEEGDIPPLDTEIPLGGPGTFTPDNEAEVKDAEEAIKDKEAETAADDLKTSNPGAFDQVSGLLKDYFGLEPQDLKRAIGMYMLSRLAGGSHATAMTFAGRQVLGKADERAEEAKKTTAVYTRNVSQLKNSGLLNEENEKELRDIIKRGDLVEIEEALGDPKYYSSLYNDYGIRPDSKTTKIMHESSTRPIEAYSIGGGDYVTADGQVLKYSEGYKPHLSEDQIRDDVFQNLEDYKVPDSSGVPRTVIDQESQAAVLFNVAKTLKARGLPDNPVALTGHLQDLMDNMHASGQEINKQTLEANLIGTLVMGDTVKDVSKIANKDGTGLLSTNNILGFGEEFTTIFDDDEKYWKDQGINTTSELIRKFDQGWDPTKNFDRAEAISGKEIGTEEVKDAKWKKLINNAPNDYMAYMYWNAYLNRKKT